MGEPRYPPRVVASKLDAYAEQLATWLKADAHRGRRDRRTVKLMYEELTAQGYKGGYGRVASFARRWREQQAGSAAKGAFVPLKFALGKAFQFDWSTEYAFVGGLRRRLEVAHTKLCASRAFWLVAYPTQSHEMLFDAHARAFAAFGGVPQRGIYDNMKTAVDKVGVGKARVDQRALRGHDGPPPFDGYVEVLARVSSTALVHLQRNRYSVPSEHAHEVVSLRLYPDRLDVVAENTRVATHVRSFERSQTFYDWRHYVSLIERKPRALRNGAPFETLPEPLKKLQSILLRHEGRRPGDGAGAGGRASARAGGCAGGRRVGPGGGQAQRRACSERAGAAEGAGRTSFLGGSQHTARNWRWNRWPTCSATTACEARPGELPMSAEIISALKAMKLHGHGSHLPGGAAMQGPGRKRQGGLQLRQVLLRHRRVATTAVGPRGAIYAINASSPASSGCRDLTEAKLGEKVAELRPRSRRPGSLRARDRPHPMGATGIRGPWATARR